MRTKKLNEAGLRSVVRKILIEQAAEAPDAAADDTAILAALNAVVENAKLPVKITSATTADYPVPVPPGFESLFSKISIGVRALGGRYAGTFDIYWRYEHPDGGENGISVGYVMKNPDGRWGWRIETPTKKSGYV